MLKSDVLLISVLPPDDWWWPEIQGLSCGKSLPLALKPKAPGFEIFVSKPKTS